MKVIKEKNISRTICFIRSRENKYGGAEVYLNRLTKALSSRNIEHQIIHSIFPNFLPSWLRVILFNIQVLLSKGDRFYFSLDRISCPDIYRAGDGVHRVFLNVEKKSKTNPLHRVYLFFEKRCFKKAKCIIVNSNMVKHQIIDTYKINPSKIRLVRNGIKIQNFNRVRALKKLTEEFSLDSNEKYLLYVGSGYKRKGVEEFLKIISKLRFTNLKAFVIGKEKNIRYYIDLAKSMNLEEKVFFTGPRDDVNAFYAISDIFLFPTHYEPFANVVLEAMSFENAIFTTRQNGASEILDNEFIMNSPQDFSVVSSINNLLKNDNKLIEVKLKNRVKAEQFTIESNLDKTMKIINEFIN
jgi:UDP-glucose:(heptosyl)LPS alpha-1,3-glucosyltransferase